MGVLAVVAEETSEVTVGASPGLVIATALAVLLTVLVVVLLVRWARR